MPFKTGLAEAVTVISGVTFDIVLVETMLEAAA